jgi:hypothetical protein
MRPPLTGPPALEAQCRHQLRVWRKRMTWWIPSIFVVGLAVSLLGLVAYASDFTERGFTTGLLGFSVFTLFFGSICVQWLLAPLLIRPRVVPYFVRQLSEYGGATTAAFRRGRGLYSEMGALDQFAVEQDVTPLSTFGFAYDYYDQNVLWHSASRGLATIEALRAGLDARAASGLVADLDALAGVLRVAAEQNVEFCLIVRLHAKDSMQGVMTRESRQGSFW